MLRDLLLYGKVIGETFRTGGSDHKYTVMDLHLQSQNRTEFVCLVTKESDGKQHHYNLATRLYDLFVQSEQTTQSKPSGDPAYASDDHPTDYGGFD